MAQTVLFDHEDCAKILLEAAANPNTIIQGEHTSLIRAASKGHDSFLKLLIAKGADVNASSDDVGTALMCATISGCETRVLLKVL